MSLFSYRFCTLSDVMGFNGKTKNNATLHFDNNEILCYTKESLTPWLHLAFQSAPVLCFTVNDLPILQHKPHKQLCIGGDRHARRACDQSGWRRVVCSN